MVRKSVGIGLLALGLSGCLGGMFTDHYYREKQNHLPAEVHRVYEINYELDKPITARKILESASQPIRYYETLQKELEGLISQEEVTKNVNAYERYNQYREYTTYSSFPSLFMLFAGMFTLPFSLPKTKKN